MRIRTQISLWTISLVCCVVVSISVNLMWLESRRVHREFAAHADLLMEGVLRIARESLSANDELMLLSYLKFLMRDYPEVEQVLVSREGHTSVIGEAKSDLLYRTLTITDPEAAEFKAERVPGEGRLSSLDDRTIPPGTFTIQTGFSRAVLARRIHEAMMALAFRAAGLACVGLLLGVLGSIWLGRLLAKPVAALALAAQNIGEGKLGTSVEVCGTDEIADLSRRFNQMASRLQESTRFKEDLLGTLTHELNTPLGGLKGFLQYLAGSDASQEPAQRLDAYQTMTDAVRQMEISMTNALHLFKTDARPSIHPERLALDEVVDEVVRLFTPMARSNDVNLEGPSRGAPVCLMMADKELIRRVVINLVSNALKYSPPGSSVRIRIEDGVEEARLSVQDDGPGIAPEEHERIFTKFYRVSGTGGRPQRIPGSGLGLAIAKQAVDLHNGRIWVDSKVGEGSVFSFTLPKTGGGDA